MFSQACVIPSVHRGRGEGWLPSMHYWSHDQGVCIQGVCIQGGCIRGSCIQDGFALGGGQTPPGIVRDMVNTLAACILWNAFLLDRSVSLFQKVSIIMTDIDFTSHVNFKKKIDFKYS